MSGDSTARITQKDIAERAGVSVMTVSLALRGAAKVSPGTVKRIRALAEEMGYAPNPLVSSLMRTRRGRGKDESGLAIAWHGAATALPKQERGRKDRCDTYAEMLEGARQACKRNGFDLKLFQHHESGPELPRVLRARGIRGLVLGPLGPRKFPKFNPDELNGLHLIRIGPGEREKSVDLVERNFFDEMRTCVDALEKEGCRRIGFIDYFGHQAQTGDRWKGAFLASARDGLKLCAPSLPSLKGTIPDISSQERLKAYINQYKPDGLVIGGRVFVEAMVKRIKAGKALPFVCLERNAWPDWISGVETNYQQIGADAAQLLINRILSPYSIDTAQRTTTVHSAWHEGTSHQIPSRGKARK